MAIKTLETRIKFKYDLYENWKDSELVLLPGEIGLCEIPGTTKTVVENGKTVNVTTAPTVLFKVGNSEGTPFKNLPWASAKAADVYSWAKAFAVKRDGKKLVFVGGGVDGADLEVAFDYYTESDVKAITNPLAARIEAVEAAIGVDSGSEGSVSARLTAIEGSVEVINGEGEGSVAKAEADAKAYTDEKVVEVKAYADQAEADAISAAETASETKVAVERARINALEAADEAQDTLISNNKTAIEKEVSDREAAISGVVSGYEAADLAINNKIGSVTEGKTVVEMISDAKTAAVNSANEFATGKYNTNAAAIEALSTKIDNEVTRATGVEADFETRISTMEVFWKSADNSTEVVDTLTEIQNYITNDKTGAAGMLESIQGNAQAIEGLDGRLDTAETDINNLEARTEAVEGRATALETLTAGDWEGKTIKTRVEEVSVRAEKGITDAADAKAYVDTREAAIKTAYEAYADQAETDAVATAKGYTDGKVSELNAKDEALVAEDSRLAGLISGNTTAIGNEETARKAADDAINAKFGADYDKDNTVASAIADAKKAGTDAQGTANANAGRLEAIEADYLKEADLFIIDCGSATKVVHTN